jgi:NAD(P)H-dependent FMN reductase
MITIISGTNRRDSYTKAVTETYAKILSDTGAEVQVLSLEQLPKDVAFEDYNGEKSEELQSIIEKYVAHVEKFVFIIPEYQGSYPGILKVFLDMVQPKMMNEKRAAIIGLSSGHAGNLRGQEHLTGVLHYLKMHVHYNKPKLSAVSHLFNANLEMTDDRTLKLLIDHAHLIVKF